MSWWVVFGLEWAAVVVATLELMGINGGQKMTEDAVTRAIQSATREAFSAGVAAARLPGSERERKKRSAMEYAEGLVLPIVEMAVQQALEAQWIEDHGRRNSAPDRTL